MLTSRRDDMKNTTSSSATVPSDSDKKRGTHVGTHFGGSGGGSVRPGGAVRVQTQLSKPGVKDEVSSGIQVLHVYPTCVYDLCHVYTCHMCCYLHVQE